MALLDVPGGRLHYRIDEAARPAAPVVVLSNSLGTTLDMWAGQCDALRQHFRLVRYDTRGHGLSVNSAPATTVAELGGDVVALLDHLRIDRAHFVGLSMGGQTGMWLGAHARARIDRLVLCNTAALIGPASIWNDRIAAVASNGVAPMVPAVIARWFTAPFVAAHPDAVEPIAAMLRGADPTGYIAACCAVRDTDLRADLTLIGAPTLVVAGRHDPATTLAQGRELVAAIAAARLLELDAAHLSNIEAHAAFNAGVVAFLLGDDRG